MAMAELLQASKLNWSYGPAAPAVVPTATMSTRLLRTVVDVPETSSQLLAIEAAWAREVLA
jgi:hypothetical protein